MGQSRGSDSYLGLGSVRHGDTSQCIEDIFAVHFPDARTVADLTWGKGRFWKRRPDLSVVGMDVDPRGGAQIVSDYRTVPLRDKCVDVAVHDPPFIFSPGLRGIVGAKRFFLGGEGRFYNGPKAPERVLAPRNGADLEAQTISAMVEMRRIARYGCILKGQDLIYTAKPNWWTFNVMTAGQQLWGELPEDVLLQVSPAARLRDPKWKRQYHFRRQHAIYVIYLWDAPDDASN